MIHNDLLAGDTPDIIDADDVRTALNEWESICTRCGATLNYEHTNDDNGVRFVDDEGEVACLDDDDVPGVHLPEDEDREVLTDLLELDDEIGTSDALISDSYWPEYARQMVEDTSAPLDSWLKNYIDWERVANDVQSDYTSIEYRGTTYWGR